ncbi:hypothetical protein D0469_08010 [Peribacillus saganii]|uniref:Oxidoreductase molybdopterin-binding domain-containing protein n=1 Tax=Peribacillus saganii TaxID=2303992 RepID=A0A372LPS1_9BACI|nr:molybdopterin-dependent oxidoreductase [Peribacillus saganii]RFU70116.1 hypothetical protein D0469_08010 [Peribacillus saganii]
MGRRVRNKQVFYWIHFVHGFLILFLLISGLFLYNPDLRTFLGEFRAEFREFHSALGIVYTIFLCLVMPFIIRYDRLQRRWQKTFHLSLQLLFGLGWITSGIYLWVNSTEYVSIRQAALLIHDVLSLAIIPWVAVHILLWYLRRDNKIDRRDKRKTQDKEQRNRGIVISRRDVLLLFGGAVVSFAAGGLLRWYQPLSENFTNALETVKTKGYFRIYSIRSENPVFQRETWRLTVDGLVDNPSSFSFDELLTWKASTFSSDFHCVTGWSVLDVKWKGILFKDVMERVKARSGGVYVKMYSADLVYTETFELSQLLEQNVILAYELDGRPLIDDQGAPLRLLHPNMYGYKSIKWLNRIEIVKDRGLGYWEEKEGYDLNGYLD